MKYQIRNIFDEPPVTTHDGTVNLVRLIKNLEESGQVATFNYVWLNQGQEVDHHQHDDGSEYYLFLEGKGEVLIDKDWLSVEPGSFVKLASGQQHSVRNQDEEKLVFISPLKNRSGCYLRVAYCPYPFDPSLAAFLAAKSIASSIAQIIDDGSAVPLPAMSKAVPWSGDVLIIGRPSVTLTASLQASSLIGISPWS